VHVHSVDLSLTQNAIDLARACSHVDIFVNNAAP
jgi:hypothetical protein